MKEEQRNNENEMNDKEECFIPIATVQLHREHHDVDQARKAPNGRQDGGRNQELPSFVPQKGEGGKTKGDDIDQDKNIHNPEAGGFASKPGQDQRRSQVAQESEHQGGDLDSQLQFDEEEGIQLWKGIYHHHHRVLASLKGVPHAF